MAAKITNGTRVRDSQTLLTGVVTGHYETGTQPHYLINIEDGQKMGGRKLDGQKSSWAEEHIVVINEEDVVAEDNTTDDEVVETKLSPKEEAYEQANAKNYFELQESFGTNVYVLDSVEWKERTEEELTLSIKQLLQHRHEEQTYTTEKERVQELRQRRVYILLHVEALRRLRVSEENNVDDNVDDNVDNEATIVIAEAITKARWGSLTITVEDIATQCDTTTDNVNNVIASETYLNVIRETFNKRKGWQTWAKKGASIVAKRLWITEEQATTIIEGINK